MSAVWMEKVILVLKTIFSTIRRVKAGATLEMKKQSNLTSDHRTAPLNHTFHPLSSYLQLLVSFSLLLFINTIKLNMLSRQSTSKPSPFALSASFNTYLIGSRLSTTHFHRSFHETSALYHTVCPHAWYSNQRLNRRNINCITACHLRIVMLTRWLLSPVIWSSQRPHSYSPDRAWWWWWW